MPTYHIARTRSSPGVPAMSRSIHTWVSLCYNYFVRVRNSVNSFLEQSPRDDLESLFYIMVYFYKGSLAWQGLRADTKEQKLELIREKKMSTPTHVLCSGMPDGVVILLNCVCSLRFDEEPDYSFLRNTVHDLFARELFQRNSVFDWTVYKYLRYQQAIEQARGREREQQTPIAGQPILPDSCAMDGVEILTPPESPPELGLRSGEPAVMISSIERRISPPQLRRGCQHSLDPEDP